MDKLRGTGLPNPDTVTHYNQLPGLVGILKSTHADALATGLQIHPELQQAWTIIQDSAHPESYAPINPNLCTARRRMVADLISVIITGELVAVEEAT